MQIKNTYNLKLQMLDMALTVTIQKAYYWLFMNGLQPLALIAQS